MYFVKELLASTSYKKGEVIAEYTTPGAYTLEIKCDGVYEIEAVSGGSGGLYCDGGTDAFSNTSWAWHYYVRGATGAYFKGLLQISRGNYTVNIGKGGTGTTGHASGNGGDTKISDLFILVGAYGCGYDGSFNGGAGGYLQTSVKETTTYAVGQNDGYYRSVKDNNNAGDYNVNALHSSLVTIPNWAVSSYGYGGYAKGYGNTGSGGSGYLKVTYKGLR